MPAANGRPAEAAEGSPHPSLRTAIEVPSEQGRLGWELSRLIANLQAALQSQLHDQQETSKREAGERIERLELQIERLGEVMGKNMAGWHEDVVAAMSAKMKEQEERAEALQKQTEKALGELSTTANTLSLTISDREQQAAAMVRTSMERMQMEKLLDEQVVSKINKTCDDRLSTLHKQHIRLLDSLVDQVRRLGGPEGGGGVVVAGGGGQAAAHVAVSAPAPQPEVKGRQASKESQRKANDVGRSWAVGKANHGGPAHLALSSEKSGAPSCDSSRTDRDAEDADQDGVNVEMLKAVQGWSKNKGKDKAGFEGEWGAFERYRNSFEVASSVVILANLVFMGVETDITMTYVQRAEDAPGFLYWMNVVFAILFTVELLIRMSMERYDFFTGQHWRWNLMDAILVLLQIVDIAFVFVNLGFMRALRAVRSLRGVRVIKTVTYVRELRLMIAALSCSLYSLMWSFVLLVLVLYLFALGLEQTLVAVLESRGMATAHPDFLEFYGSLGSAMLSLFKAISGGADWADLVLPLERYSRGYILFFMWFITFTVFGMLNILTAVFVESTNRIAEVDSELVIQEHMDRENSVVGKIRDFLKKTDSDGSGTISKTEFEEHLGDKRFQAQLNMLGLEPVEAQGVFRILNVNDTDEVEIEEFIYGLMRLKGNAKAVDVVTMLYESKRIDRRLLAFMKWTEDSFRDLRYGLGLRTDSSKAISVYLTQNQNDNQHVTRDLERSNLDV